MRAFCCLSLIALTSPVLAAGIDPMITGNPPTSDQPVVSDAVPPAATPVRPPAETASPLTDNDPATRSEKLDALFAELRRDATSEGAEKTVDQIQRVWAKSGSATVDLMLLWAGKAMTDSRRAAAFDFLDQAILLKPDFAEAWNKRATLNYMASDYGKSLADIEKTLQLEPRHFGALMGLGAIREATDRKKPALEAYMRVLAIYPTLKSAQDAVGRLSEELTGQRI